MFKLILLCSLLAQTIWAKPVHQHHSEVAPHVLIVTPQAQLRLDSLVSGASIIQHLSPFTRYISPHEETIVYVPASAAAAIQNAEIVARSLEGNKGKQFNPSDFASTVGALASSGAQSIQSAAQSAAESANNYIASSTSFGTALGNPASSLQSSAEAFFQGAQNAINSFSQGQSPSQEGAQAQVLSAEGPLVATEIALPPIISEQKLPIISTGIALPSIASAEQKLPVVSLGSKIPPLSPLLQPILPSISIYTNEPRHHYIVAPSAPHVVDFVPHSILLSPAAAATIKSRRSILADDKDTQSLVLPASKPSLYASNNELEKKELLLKEKKDEFKRFLEAHAVKEEPKEGQLQSKAEKDTALPTNEKKEILPEKAALELKSAPDSAHKPADESFPAKVV